jgi:putative oxidoreductase
MRFGPELLRDFGLLLIRLIVGAVFIFHGGQKLFGLWDGPGLGGFATYLDQLGVSQPALCAVLAAAAEFGGGLCLISGLWVRIAVIPMAATMAVAIALVHPNAFALERNGMEYPLTLAVVLLGLAFTGAGRLSLGNLQLPPRSLPTADRSPITGRISA